jgi:hypothetical protein
MEQSTTSTLNFIATVAAATLAATLMSSNARAEGPIEDYRPAVSARSRAEVKAEMMMQRDQLTSYAMEWAQQQPGALLVSGTTREQVRADYVASRETVRAMTAEDSGSAYLAHQSARAPLTMTADAAMR